jgi:TonB family protein
MARAEPAGASARPEIAVDGPAFLRTWCPPVYPARALRNRIEGRVVVRLIVDENGNVGSARVLEATNPEFADAALEAAKRWLFTPALYSGRPVACSVDAPVVFSPDNPLGRGRLGGVPPNGEIPQLSPTQAARPLSWPAVDFPDVLFDRRLPGRVLYSCEVLANGHEANPRILRASHVDFVLPALGMLGRCEFSPAMQGELPIGSHVEGRITFDALGAGAANLFTANLISDADGKPPLDDVTLQAVVDPVWPFELLLKGESGSATVFFTVEENGTPRNLRVSEASDPEFGQALAAAVDLCVFSASSPAGRPLAGPLRLAEPLKQRAEFNAADAGAEADSNPLARLVAELRGGGIGGSDGLDEGLVPLYRVDPVFPSSVDPSTCPSGTAEIEFIVDRSGRARLPRILSASRREFGWAAATAASQWVFNPPRRGGQPVDARLRVPFRFTAPSGSRQSFTPPSFYDHHP